LKKLSITVSIVFSLLVCGTFTNSPAMLVTLEFTATGFGSDAPQDPVSGTFTWDADTLYGTINTLTSVNLSIAGRDYQLADLSFESPWGPVGSAIYGALNYRTVVTGTDDFFFDWVHTTSPAGIEFIYTSAGQSGTYQTLAFQSFSITESPRSDTLSYLASRVRSN
jgi:hypothetical protein